jgi:hypothetical protein
MERTFASRTNTQSLRHADLPNLLIKKPRREGIPAGLSKANDPNCRLDSRVQGFFTIRATSEFGFQSRENGLRFSQRNTGSGRQLGLHLVDRVLDVERVHLGDRGNAAIGRLPNLSHRGLHTIVGTQLVHQIFMPHPKAAVNMINLTVIMFC